MKTTKKAMLLTVCALVLVAATVMGTMAYLTDNDTVTNTFNAGVLLSKFELKEHEIKREVAGGAYSLNMNKETQANTYTVVPGMDLPKDPFVRVDVDENAYLFLEVDNNMVDGMTFDIDLTEWKLLLDAQNDPVKKNENPIYVRAKNDGKVLASEGEIEINVLANKQVVVGKDLDVGTLKVDDGVPAKTLVFNAYIGQANITGVTDALGAWNAMFK